MSSTARVLYIACFAFCLAPAVSGQDTDDAVDVKLDAVVDRWDKLAATIQAVDIRFTRTCYDSVFLTIKQSTGRYYFEAPERGRCEIQPVGLPKDTKINRSGNQYSLILEQPETWIWTHEDLIWINESSKSYSIYPKVEKGWMSAFSNPRNIFPLFDRFSTRFEFSLIKQTTDQLFVRAVPRAESDEVNYSEVFVAFDLQTGIPTALKLVDPARTKETLFIFSEFRINPQLADNDDPLKVDLNGYQPHQARYSSPPRKPDQRTALNKDILPYFSIPHPVLVVLVALRFF